MSAPSFFATTRWTLVRDAARGGDTLAVEALGTLAGTYWQPLYRYARRKGKSPEDAEDLVQGFLVHVIEARAYKGTYKGTGLLLRFRLAMSGHPINIPSNEKIPMVGELAAFGA